jgi:putative toxin-antitoxin system antitoxin component (TIGR02293 family)
MPKLHRKATKKSRRGRRAPALGTEPVGVPPSRSLRLVPNKDAAAFKTFVSKETPTAKKVALIRRGVAARIVDDMAHYLGVPKGLIFGVLHAPESTAHRLIKDNRTLDSAASERVVRVADVMRMAEETFGGREAAARWLRSPNIALAGTMPLANLDTEPGAGEVRRILLSINYGGAF